METPGFTWRVSLSVLVSFSLVIFLILWLLFYAGKFNIYQNIAAILYSFLIGIAILVPIVGFLGDKIRIQISQ